MILWNSALYYRHPLLAWQDHDSVRYSDQYPYQMPDFLERNDHHDIGFHNKKYVVLALLFKKYKTGTVFLFSYRNFQFGRMRNALGT